MFSPRLRAASITQRIASAMRRDERTSTGTWYVAPPTRRDFTSTAGATLLSAFSTRLDRLGVLLADRVERAVHDLLRDRLLAALHHHVDEAGDDLAPVLGIRQQEAGRG